MSKLSLVLEQSGDKAKASVDFERDKDDQVRRAGSFLLRALGRRNDVVIEEGKELYSELPPPEVKYEPAPEKKKEAPPPAPEPVRAEPEEVPPEPAPEKEAKKVAKKAATKKTKK